MEKKLALFANGFHPPWTEGSVNVLYGWTKILQSAGFDFEAFSYVDPIRGKGEIDFPNFTHPIKEKEARLRSLISIVEKARQLGFYSTDPIIQFWYSFTGKMKNLLQAQSFKTCYGHIWKNYDVLHFHNVGYPISWRFVKEETSRIIRSYLRSTLTEILRNGYFKWADSVVTTSLKLYCQLKKIDRFREKISYAPPYVPLPERDKYMTQHVPKEDNLFPSLHDAKEEGRGITLYLGNVNKFRFSLSVFSSLLKMLSQTDGILVIVTQPMLDNLLHLRRFYKFLQRNKKLKNRVYVINENLTPVEKDTLYCLADIFLFPAYDERNIDPPLTVIEAILRNTFVVTSSIGSLPWLTKFSGYGKSVSAKGDFIKRFAEDAKEALENPPNGKPNKSFKRHFGFENVKKSLEEVYSI